MNYSIGDEKKLINTQKVIGYQLTKWSVLVYTYSQDDSVFVRNCNSS